MNQRLAGHPTLAHILEISAFPPPRAGWSVRVEFLKKQLERDGHRCVVLNIGTSRRIPSAEYETVVSGFDYAAKLFRYSRQGFRVHAHVNGDSPKGFVLALVAELVNLAHGTRPILTFHAGLDQTYFPREKSLAAVPLFKLLFGLARRVVCNTEAVRAKIVEYGVPPGKVVAIPAFSRQYLEFQHTALAPQVEAFYAAHRILFSYIRVRPSFDLLTLIEGFAQLARTDPSIGLLLVGLTEDVDRALWQAVEDRIRQHGLEPRVCVVPEFDHDEFRTALSRAAVYVRTPTSDGASSSVLEALALGIPVVAAANGTRPPGVITYPAGNAGELAGRVTEVLVSRERIVRDMPRPLIADTLADEIRVLTEG